MKKVLLLGLVLILALSAFALTGCGGDADDTTDDVTTTTDDDGQTLTVGITQIVDHPALNNTRDGFLQALADEGFVQGQNLTVIDDVAQGDTSVAQQIAQNFVAKNVDLIFAISTPSAQAAQNAALDTDVPVLFGAISDPVGAGLSNEDGTGIGNISGVSDALPVASQLEMIRELLPDATTIGIVYNTGEDNSLSSMEEVNALAPDHGFTIEEVGITAVAEVPGAVDQLLAKNVDTFYVITDNMVVDQLAAVLEKTDEANVPVFGSEVEQVRKGAVATEGIEYTALGYEAGKMAAQIFRGEKTAGEIPFFQFTSFFSYLNKAAAEGIGLEFPQSMLDNATEVFTTLDR
jgi:putative ABC transport system substrate-binding protein